MSCSISPGRIDESSGPSVGAFAAQVNEFIRAAHADGTLKAMSAQWYGVDYATPAGQSDLITLAQQLS